MSFFSKLPLDIRFLFLPYLMQFQNVLENPQMAFSTLTDLMIVSIATQKGGAGKTTTSIALSAGLARKGKKVLLVDIDQQANSSKVLLRHYPTITKEQSVHATIIERKPLPIHKTDVPNLDIVPGHILLSNTDVELTIAKDRREDRLKRELDKVKDNYEYVFIDCPPNLGWLTINALNSSDQVIIIVAPGYFELDSIVQFYKTIAEVQEFFNPDLQLKGILFTRSDPTVNTRESLTILRQMYGKELLPVIIPENTDLRNAHFNKQDIFAYNPHAKGAVAYDKLINELFL